MLAMSLINVFKRQESNLTSNVLQASATLYPNKNLIDTVDRVKEGFGISSIKITTLSVDTDSQLIGATLKHHLNLTQINLPIPKDYKKHYADFLIAASFKNAKEHHKDASLLMIHQKDDIITISPTMNGGATGKDRGFLGIKGVDIVLKAETNNKDLGDKIRFAWTKCESKSI
jgi:hypothetical protein